MYCIGLDTVCTLTREKLRPDMNYAKKWRVGASLHAGLKLSSGPNEIVSELMLFIYGCPMSLTLE